MHVPLSLPLPLPLFLFLFLPAGVNFHVLQCLLTVAVAAIPAVTVTIPLIALVIPLWKHPKKISKNRSSHLQFANQVKILCSF